MGRNITLLLLAGLVGCGAPATEGAVDPTPQVAPTATAAPASPPPAAEAPKPPTVRLPRVVAVGDLHADLATTLAVLKLAGLVDDSGAWVGGDAVLVQTGDQTDRGPDSKEVLELLMALTGQAAAAGGRVEVLLGNHEVMNMMGDLRYVNPKDVEDFGSPAARAAALSASGELGAWLRERPMTAVVDRVAYVHGGITPRYAQMGVAGINGLVGGVLAGTLPADVLGDDSPIWYRGYLQGDELAACPELERALTALGAERMVVGHTTRRDGRIASRCGGRLLGIDTGISTHYGGHLAALELRAGDAWALYPEGPEDLPDP
ncbi:MAG: metallophosphoesterase [Alphaproteobacteria bacterium]|nr:metallophosphoesterase [Alphaproteobacteria bacterium]